RHEIGIDIEQLRALPDMMQIAETWFHPEEFAAFQAAGSIERAQKFFEIWTKKEAACKARGIGIANGLELVDESARECRVRRVNAPRGYVAALASQHEHRAIHYYDWE